jgi:hypothetical protein
MKLTENPELLRDRENINRLAEELVKLDPEKDSSTIVGKTSRIWNIVWNNYSYSGKSSYKSDDFVDSELFDFSGVSYNIFEKVIETNLRTSKRPENKGKWVFNPEEGDFCSTIRRKVLHKVKVNNKEKLGECRNISIEESSEESENKAYSPLDKYSFKAYQQTKTEKDLDFDALNDFSELIINYKLFEKTAKPKECFYASAFFTYEIIKPLREDYTPEYENSPHVFIAMDEDLLDYLYSKKIEKLFDISTFDFKPDIKFKARQKNIAKAKGIDPKTVVDRQRKYDKFKENWREKK